MRLIAWLLQLVFFVLGAWTLFGDGSWKLVAVLCLATAAAALPRSARRLTDFDAGREDVTTLLVGLISLGAGIFALTRLHHPVLWAAAGLGLAAFLALAGRWLPEADSQSPPPEDGPLLVDEHRMEVENEVLWKTGKVFRRP